MKSIEIQMNFVILLIGKVRVFLLFANNSFISLSLYYNRDSSTYYQSDEMISKMSSVKCFED